jgi:hypothetical protein
MEGTSNVGMENCGCYREEDLKRAGLRPRLLSFYPESLARKVDDDRIIHCLLKKSQRCPPPSYEVVCELESNPAVHPFEHLFRQNGFKKLGACKFLSDFVYSVK